MMKYLSRLRAVVAFVHQVGTHGFSLLVAGWPILASRSAFVLVGSGSLVMALLARGLVCFPVGVACNMWGWVTVCALHSCCL